MKNAPRGGDFCPTRRRASGDTAWNWNAGIATPKLPARKAPVKQAWTVER